MEDNHNSPMHSSGEGMSPKNVGIVAYVTLIGWIIAMLQNKKNPSGHGSFHVRQMLGISIMMFAGGILGIFGKMGGYAGSLVQVSAFILWVLGIISAFQGEQKPVPFLGEKFQEWFKSF